VQHTLEKLRIIHNLKVQINMSNHCEVDQLGDLLSTDNAKTIRRKIHEALSEEAASIKHLSSANSVQFCENVKKALDSLFSHLFTITDSFHDSNNPERKNGQAQLDELYVLVLTHYNIRSHVMQEVGDELVKSMFEVDEYMAEIFISLSEHFSSVASGMRDNMPDTEKDVLDVIIDEVTRRYKFMKGQILIYNEKDDGAVVAFILKKLCKIAKRQAAKMRELLFDMYEDLKDQANGVHSRYKGSVFIDSSHTNPNLFKSSDASIRTISTMRSTREFSEFEETSAGRMSNPVSDGEFSVESMGRPSTGEAFRSKKEGSSTSSRRSGALLKELEQGLFEDPMFINAK